jgi:hypothetical protein
LSPSRPFPRSPRSGEPPIREPAEIRRLRRSRNRPDRPSPGRISGGGNRAKRGDDGSDNTRWRTAVPGPGIRLSVAGNGGRGKTRQKPASIAWTHRRSHFRPPNPRCRRSCVFRLRRAWSVRRVPLACIPQTQGPKEFLEVADLHQSWANRRFLFSTTYESPELVRVLRLCKEEVRKSSNNQPGFSQPRRAGPTGISVDRLP